MDKLGKREREKEKKGKRSAFTCGKELSAYIDKWLCSSQWWNHTIHCGRETRLSHIYINEILADWIKWEVEYLFVCAKQPCRQEPGYLSNCAMITNL